MALSARQLVSFAGPAHTRATATAPPDPGLPGFVEGAYRDGEKTCRALAFVAREIGRYG